MRRNGTPNCQLIAGGRRLEAVRKFTKKKTILARIIEADDLQARRISAAENIQREDLSAVEMIEAMVGIVDAELIEDKEYASMGKKPVDRVKALLGKLRSIKRNKQRGYSSNNDLKKTSHKFVRRVEKIFKKLPKSLEWQSFYVHDLPILVDISDDVKNVSIRNGLNRSQTKALATLKAASKKEFKRVISNGDGGTSKRFKPKQVKRMRKNRISGVVQRSMIVGRKEFVSP